jgi:single-stranded-DNA-specific exonuclease
MEIKNLKKAALRIKKAIRNKERIILYGDSDMDGVSSVIIAKEAILNLGGKVLEIYFPDREKEGYGITKRALNFLKKYSPSLLITFDCGISNFKEVILAKKMGFEIIIIDHHEILDKLPQSSIIVDPKQKGDRYPFKFFASAGLAYKLSQTLFGGKLTAALKRNFLELAALATIADMMPEEADNKAIIEEGLVYLEQTFRPGLRVFLEMTEIKNQISTRKIAQEIISVLNIVEPKGHLNATYLLLSAVSLAKSRVLAERLLTKRDKKRAEIREITAQIEEKILRNPGEPVVFEGSSLWPVALLGGAASRICAKYQKPTFIVSKKEKESRGAVRTPKGIDGVALLKKCAKYLLSFGGHPPAAGFAIKNENLDKFRTCLLRNYEKGTKIRNDDK